MKLSRRQFVRLQGLVAGGVLLIPAMNSFRGFSSEKIQRNKSDRFRLAFCGTSEEFDFYRKILQNSFSGNLIAVRPGRVRHLRPNAVWVGSIQHKRYEHISGWLNQGIHVLTEPPAPDDPALFSLMQKNASLHNARAGFSYYHRFQTSSEKAADLVSRGVLGTLQSIKIQLNDPEKDQLMTFRHNSFLGPGTCLIDLVRFITGINSGSVQSGSLPVPGKPLPDREINLRMDFGGVPALYSNIRHHLDDTAGWSIQFIGNRGQMKLSTDNRLEILEREGWRTLENGRSTDFVYAVRMLVNDFLVSATYGKEPEVNLTDAMAAGLTEASAKKAALTQQVILTGAMSHDSR